MRVVVQRAKQASVSIDGEVVGAIGAGMVVLAGFEHADKQEDIEWIAGKLARLRIFDDHQGVMNLSIQEVGGEALVVSQFTLHAKTRKGNRPSYIQAAPPEIAIPLYNSFIELLSREIQKPVATGRFGAMMDVSLVNDGPVTIIIDSKNRE